jgi:hypothetical protein
MAQKPNLPEPYGKPVRRRETARRHRQIADAIVDRLFINGSGERAERLMLEWPLKNDLGGWCRSAVRDVIVAALGGG